MNVITFASRKGGSGKSTLAAHLSALAARPALLIDADPQGSLDFWHRLRRAETPLLIRSGARSIPDMVEAARREGARWTFIDTPPNRSATVADAIRAATLVVIPTRPAVFDLAAVRETIALARDVGKPYAVVINAAPCKRGDVESAVVADARAALNEFEAPVWAGQISQRAALAASLATGEAVAETQAECAGAAEIEQLWRAIQRSVGVIRARRPRAPLAA